MFRPDGVNDPSRLTGRKTSSILLSIHPRCKRILHHTSHLTVTTARERRRLNQASPAAVFSHSDRVLSRQEMEADESSGNENVASGTLEEGEINVPLTLRVFRDKSEHWKAHLQIVRTVNDEAPVSAVTFARQLLMQGGHCR